MNKKLVIAVLILLPIAVFTDKEKKLSSELVATTRENIRLEVPFNGSKIENTEEKYLTKQVMISQNSDKSDSYLIDLEDYIIGVVAGEMPASFSIEALKAQAVAARTYALYKSTNIANYVLSTNIYDQVYLTKEQMQKLWQNDYSYYYEKVAAAVAATRGEVLMYNDSLALTYYFAISNGYTDNASYVFGEDKDYLTSVESSWDKNYSSYSSTFTMSKTNFCNRLNISCDTISITNLERYDNHYVKTITINNKEFTGVEVFKKLNLKSHDFEFTITDNGVLIKTLGFGHGVGMSQYGALGMANAGYDYKEILKHYYQNTNLVAI